MRTYSKIAAIVLCSAAAAMAFKPAEPLTANPKPRPKAVRVTPKLRLNLLRDGTAVAGADVRLAKDPSRDAWLFTFLTPVSDDKGTIRAGASVQVLPSATLQRMIESLKEADSGDFRLWGSVTQFDNKNFIYPMYFLTVSQEPNAPAPSRTEPNEPNAPVAIRTNEPNDTVVIPEEVLKMLTPKRTVDLAQLTAPGPDVQPDAVFTERAGFIRQELFAKWYFRPDALGRRVQNVSFIILPNDELRRAIAEQVYEPERVRFKVSGRLTQFNGQYYVLLQRALRQYSHENFSR